MAFLRGLLGFVFSVFAGTSGAFRGGGGSRVDADEQIEALKAVSVSRDFRTGHPELVKRFKELAESYKRMHPGRDLIASCVYRSPQEQARLYAIGRFGDTRKIVTMCDGKAKRSRHNEFPSTAIDAVVVEGGKAIWDESAYYALGLLAKQVNLEWGGFWTGPLQDYPHLQLPRDNA